MKQTFLFVSLLFATSAQSAPVELTCRDPKDGWSMQVTFDENKKTVASNGMPNQKPIFTNSIIYFDTNLNGILFQNTLNRSSGSMSVMHLESKEIVKIFQCSVSKNKF